MKAHRRLALPSIPTVQWAALTAGLLCLPGIALAQDAGAPTEVSEELDAFESLEALDLAELLDLDITVVSATKLATSLNEAPSIVTVVTKEDIRRWGYRNVKEALSHTLGFYVVDDHITPNVAVRGVAGGLRAESSIIKVMIDGHPIAFRPTSGNWIGSELVPIGAVEQIEVIRGPASALYGADAFMGVVNIITKSGDKARGADVRLNGNFVQSNAGFGIDAAGGQRFGKFEVFAGAHYDREDRSGIDLPTSSPAPNVGVPGATAADALGMTSATGYLRLGYEISERSRVSVGGYFSLQDRQGAFAEWAQLTGNGDADGTRIHRTNSAILAQGRFAASDAFTLTVDLTTFFGGDTGSNRIEVASPDFFVQQRQSFVGADVQLGGVWTPFDRLTVVMGTGVIVDAETLGETSLTLKQGDATPRAVSAGTDQTFLNPGLFAQATWVPVDRYLTMTGGVRYDYHNIYGSQVSGRFGAVSNPVNGLFFKALYGSAFKAPSPVLLYGEPAQSGDIIGNPDLEPQYVHTVEGQVTYEPVRSFSVSTNVAYNYVRNLAAFSRAGFNNVARNVVEMGTLSWETSVRARYQDLVGGYLNYEMLLARRNPGQDGFQSALLGSEVGVFPALQLKAGAWFQVDAAYLRGTLQARFIGERRASDLNVLSNNASYTLDPYLVVDATVGTVDLELFGSDRATVIELIGRNLFGANAIQPGEAGVDYPITPRTLIVQLRQTL